MTPRIIAALIGLVAAVLSAKAPALGVPIDDPTANAIATGIVSFVVGWLCPPPSGGATVAKE